MLLKAFSLFFSKCHKSQSNLDLNSGARECVLCRKNGNVANPFPVSRKPLNGQQVYEN